MANIAIFVSGSGTNCENIIKYFNSADKNACVKLVVCNKPDAYAITRASRLNVPVIVMTKQSINNEATLMPVLTAYGIDYIILAGFMLMVPDFLIDRYDRLMLNIHPSLLPKFGGKGMFGHHVHEAVKAAGETETGITIHYVSKICDGGEIIAQFKTSLSTDDTVSDIETKIHALEQKHFPEVIESVINNNGK